MAEAKGDSALTVRFLILSQVNYVLIFPSPQQFYKNALDEHNFLIYISIYWHTLMPESIAWLIARARFFIQ